jgi:hypothetical protein
MISQKRSMISNNPSRTPVMIFLSDGECHIADQTMQDLCRSAVRLGSVPVFSMDCQLLIQYLAKHYHSIQYHSAQRDLPPH